MKIRAWHSVIETASYAVKRRKVHFARMTYNTHTTATKAMAPSSVLHTYLTSDAFNVVKDLIGL